MIVVGRGRVVSQRSRGLVESFDLALDPQVSGGAVLLRDVAAFEELFEAVAAGESGVNTNPPSVRVEAGGPNWWSARSWW